MYALRSSRVDQCMHPSSGGAILDSGPDGDGSVLTYIYICVYTGGDAIAGAQGVAPAEGLTNENKTIDLGFRPEGSTN